MLRMYVCMLLVGDRERHGVVAARVPAEWLEHHRRHAGRHLSRRPCHLTHRIHQSSHLRHSTRLPAAPRSQTAQVYLISDYFTPPPLH